eukprot:scaffold312504_cov31-Tisochrysis_lutea.AAC.3
MTLQVPPFVPLLPYLPPLLAHSTSRRCRGLRLLYPPCRHRLLHQLLALPQSLVLLSPPTAGMRWLAPLGPPILEMSIVGPLGPPVAV